jgi:hypothetical protein
MVIRYSYLWRAEHATGQEEGVKDRPCAVVLVTRDGTGKTITIVLPVTHVAPRELASAIEIPHRIKTRIGLDDEKSWIVLTEANRFVWPGPDLRPAVNGEPASIVYGQLPLRFFAEVLGRFLANYDSKSLAIVSRTE